VPVGAVNTALLELFIVKLPLISTVVYALKSSVVVTVKELVTSPVNPERLALLLSVKVPAEKVRVPVPVRVPPLRIMLVGIVGEAPSGRLQLLLTCLPEERLFTKVTLLKVMLLQVSVPPVPSKLITPPLALKTELPEIVNELAIEFVPEEALKVPPVITKVLSTSKV
jgi:hypothetical protein